MKYELSHMKFSNVYDDNVASSTISSDHDSKLIENPHKDEKFVFDLYRGCGAMSNGLCMGNVISWMKLITKWVVNINSLMCDNLRHNHLETKVKNEVVENFLTLLIELKTFCEIFSLFSVLV